MKRFEKKMLLKLIFIVYSLIMFYLLFVRNARPIESTYLDTMLACINITPFETIKLYSRVLKYNSDPYLIRISIINLFGNVLVFIPFGYLLPHVIKRFESWIRFLAFSAGIIISIEIFQLISLRGCFDIDDFSLNMVGIIIGFVIYKLTLSKENVRECIEEQDS